MNSPAGMSFSLMPMLLTISGAKELCGDVPNGVELTAKLKSRFPAIEVIVLTAYGTIEDGVHAMKNGAFDYLTKGDHQDKIIPLVNKACDKALLQQKVSDLESKLIDRFGFNNIIGSNQLLNQAVDLAK